jgi:hypothetical protein
MRGAAALGIAAAVVLIASGCATRPEAMEQRASSYATARGEADSALRAGIEGARARTIGGPVVDAGRWQIADLVCDVPPPAAVPAAGGGFVLRARAGEQRLRAVRETASLARGGAWYESAVANGLGQVRYQAVGTEYALPVTNLDMADVLLTRRLTAGEYTDRDAAEAQRDEVRKQADALRRKITVVEVQEAAEGASGSSTAAAFTPMAASGDWGRAEPVFGAAEDLEWMAPASDGEPAEAPRIVDAQSMRRTVEGLLAAAGAGRGGTHRPAPVE